MSDTGSDISTCNDNRTLSSWVVLVFKERHYQVAALDKTFSITPNSDYCSERRSGGDSHIYTIILPFPL